MFLKPSGAIARPGGKKAALDSLGITGHVERAGENAAIEHAECSICFRSMISSRPVSYLLQADNKRACRHYLHHGCLEKLNKENKPQKCAVCKAPYTSFADVPDFDTDPESFFSVVDYDKNLKLNKGEVIAVLKALIDVDYRKIEHDVDFLWELWDKNGDGWISFPEMMRPKTGLLHYVRDRYPVPKSPEPGPPKLTEKKAFFNYWDEDASGSLSVDEVCRAITKSLLVDKSLAGDVVREVVENIWPIFDQDGNGTIDEDEFCKANGLADTLIANFPS